LDLIYRSKQYLPRPLWRALTGPYWWWYNRARHQWAALVDPRLRRDQDRIAGFKDIHREKRCFVLGNGPSLRRTDLSMLENEITIGMNRIYLLFPELGYQTKYYVSVNTLVIEQCAADIKGLAMPKFITWRGRRWLRDDPGVIFMDTDYTGSPSFSAQATGRVFEGSTVTYVALQLAYFMGFQQVILVGVDHDFKTRGQANATVVAQGEDEDHFAPNYFGPGFRWQLPDLEASERAYLIARESFLADGRTILDATVGGKLTVFPKISYRDLF